MTRVAARCVFGAWCVYVGAILAVVNCAPLRNTDVKAPSAKEMEMLMCVALYDSGAEADRCADGVRAKHRDGGR